MKVERKDLVVGRKYHMDSHRDVSGVLVKRDEDTLYFDCGEQDRYITSGVKGNEGLIIFNLDGSGFEEVKLGEGLTDEDLELINSFENN